MGNTRIRVKITNLIKGGHHSLTHRKFIESTYGDLLCMPKLDGSVEGNACYDGFKKKLNLFQKMSCCKQLYEEETNGFKKYIQFIEDIILEFDDRFKDFDHRWNS
ncbi:hypothetical protein C0J52_24929 [Blattella germanica]|nr:hypothetical protein C0J52_24929 [Blattella germanica]